MRRWLLFAITAGLLAATITTWVAAAEYPGSLPVGDYEPRRIEAWTYTGPDADALRHDALSRAVFSLSPAELHAYDRAARAPIGSELRDPVPSCRFLGSPPSGTSAKFDCVFHGGAVTKVKYGRTPEIHAEAAASLLLRMLGYPSDSVLIVPRLRCYGCPRFPFITMHLKTMLALPLVLDDERFNGYTDFEWVAIERKFPAHAIETGTLEGWSWWELKDSAAPRAEVDAIRLAAVFLAHWDNKSENQRLVCLDGPPPGPNARCARPVALIQDLGATFGPSKVNLARWRNLPIWHDRATCTVSMRALPFDGSTFPDARISEAGRALMAARLRALSEPAVERLFSDARFPEFQVGTPAEADLKAWVGAFRYRADQIIENTCTDQPDAVEHRDRLST